MRVSHFLAGAALALTSVWAMAQDVPESLLPRMFDDPAPAAPRPASAAPSARPPAASTAASTAAPAAAAIDVPAPANLDDDVPADIGKLKRIPSLEELARMSTRDFEQLLGSDVIFDTPPQARRTMDRAGLLDESEGGLRGDSMAAQNGALVRLVLAANKGTLVSRWGHILLRRTLVSRLQAPKGMSDQDFVALRVALLLRMGEPDAARALLQDIDIGDYTPAIAGTALDVYAGTADFTGLCPVMATQGDLRSDAAWEVARTVCMAFRGNGAASMAALDKASTKRVMPRIDLLLAQKYAGAAGKSRRAVTIEWDDVQELTPWRYGMAIGVGLEPPAALVDAAGPAYSYVTALAPMASLDRRATAADRAAAVGVLSSAAMVDLYAQAYADAGVSEALQQRAESLRDAYTLEDPVDRVAAMQVLWNGATAPSTRYGRQVLTASAAARIPASEALAGDAGPLIASMLSGGYDANAMRWAAVVPAGSESWAMLALAAPRRGIPVDAGAIEGFIDSDESADRRKASFLVAGLAGMRRLGTEQAARYSKDLGLRLAERTRWTVTIDSAARRGDSASVVLLAAFGMQSSDWHRMTPRYLYHIVSALRQVGFEAEARMIAAEAVGRV